MPEYIDALPNLCGAEPEVAAAVAASQGRTLWRDRGGIDDVGKPLLLHEDPGKERLDDAPGLFVCPHVGGEDPDPLGVEILCLRGHLGIAEPPACRQHQHHHYERA